MNTKILLAFIGGVALTAGVGFVALRRPQPPVEASPVAEAPRPTPPPVASPPAAPPVVEVKPAEPAPAPELARVAVKPSPVAAAPSKPVAKPAQSYVIRPEPAPEPAKPAEPVAEIAKTAPEPPAPAPVVAPVVPAAPAPPTAPTPHTVTVANGTLLTVRLLESLSTDRSKPGDTFMATLDQPLVVDGFVIAERGARAQGRVVESDRGGRVNGLAQLGVELTQLTTADGQKIHVNTTAFQRQAEESRKEDAAKVGIGAALGAAIGAIAGGGKGAGIGAGVGGAAGAGDVLLTHGKPVELRTETRLTFRIAEPVTITEKLKQ